MTHNTDAEILAGIDRAIDAGTMTVFTPAPWTTIVFMQGDEADEVLRMMFDVDGVVWSGPYEEGTEHAVDYLSQWDNGEESEHTTYGEAPWGASDDTVEIGDYTLAWNVGLTYVSLNRRVAQ